MPKGVAGRLSLHGRDARQAQGTVRAQAERGTRLDLEPKGWLVTLIDAERRVEVIGLAQLEREAGGLRAAREGVEARRGTSGAVSGAASRDHQGDVEARAMHASSCLAAAAASSQEAERRGGWLRRRHAARGNAPGRSRWPASGETPPQLACRRRRRATGERAERGKERCGRSAAWHEVRAAAEAAMGGDSLGRARPHAILHTVGLRLSRVGTVGCTARRVRPICDGSGS